MANELLVMPRKFDQPIVGDKMPIQGSHVRPSSDIRIDADNTDTYQVPEGVGIEYVEMYATAAVWFRISKDGANAAVGRDEYLGLGNRIERKVGAGDIIKCVAG